MSCRLPSWTVKARSSPSGGPGHVAHAYVTGRGRSVPKPHELLLRTAQVPEKHSQPTLRARRDRKLAAVRMPGECRLRSFPSQGVRGPPFEIVEMDLALPGARPDLERDGASVR